MDAAREQSPKVPSEVADSIACADVCNIREF